MPFSAEHFRVCWAADIYLTYCLWMKVLSHKTMLLRILTFFKWVYGNPLTFLVGIRRIPAYHVDYTTVYILQMTEIQCTRYIHRTYDKHYYTNISHFYTFTYVDGTQNIKEKLTNMYKTGDYTLLDQKNSTQNLFFATAHNLQLDWCTFPSSTVKNLAFILDSNLSFKNHISHVTFLAFFHLRNIAKLRNMLTVSDAEKLVQAFMTSRLDYCNALLGGCPASSINKLQIRVRVRLGLTLTLTHCILIQKPFQCKLNINNQILHNTYSLVIKHKVLHNLLVQRWECVLYIICNCAYHLIRSTTITKLCNLLMFKM